MRPVVARHQLRAVGARNHTGLDDRTLRKAVVRGELTPVWRGVFVATSVWTGLSAEERQRLKVAAVALRSERDPVFSHATAALLHGIPTTSPDASHVDVLTSVAAGSRREHGMAKHATRALEFEVVEQEGLRITSVARTVVELAMHLPFRDALAAADWALREGIPRETLMAVLDELAVGATRKRGARVIRFASPLAGSAGESKSRALVDELGFPTPELQRRFDDADGLIGFVDFFWSEAALIGEFDGEVKYMDPGILRGRTPQQAVKDEKRREDRLRRTGPLVARWMYQDLGLQRLGAILFAAGLRPLH